MADLLRMARERPGQLRFGITGPGDTNHFATELLKAAAGVDMEAVAYRGMRDAMLDAAAGRIELVVTTVASTRALIEAGQLRLLATAAERRDPAMPEVPTVRESAGVDYVTGVWWGLFGPARLPRPVVARLNEAVGRALVQPAYRQVLASAGALPAPMVPADFAAKVRAEVGRWTAVARRAGIAAR
jgi:Uncharacterized protein conserved in bacteria